MTSLLYVLSPKATDTESANKYPPFSCNTSLEKILDEVAAKIKQAQIKHNDPVVYEHYIIFDGLFSEMSPGVVKDGVRPKLAESVYIAILDCNVFGNITSTSNTLWALMPFVQSGSQGNKEDKIEHDKIIYIIDHPRAADYQEFLLPVESKVVSSWQQLAGSLLDNLRNINKEYKKLKSQLPR